MLRPTTRLRTQWSTPASPSLLCPVNHPDILTRRRAHYPQSGIWFYNYLCTESQPTKFKKDLTKGVTPSFSTALSTSYPQKSMTYPQADVSYPHIHRGLSTIHRWLSTGTVIHRSCPQVIHRPIGNPVDKLWISRLSSGEAAVLVDKLGISLQSYPQLRDISNGYHGFPQVYPQP